MKILSRHVHTFGSASRMSEVTAADPYSLYALARFFIALASASPIARILADSAAPIN